MKHYMPLLFACLLYTATMTHGMDVTPSQSELDMSLFTSICKHDFRDIKKLLAQGANPNATICDVITPLVAACCFGNVNTVDLLIKHNVNLNPSSKMPLFIAIAGEHAVLSDYILNSLNSNDLAQHCLHAYTRGKTAIEKVIREHINKINATDNLKKTLFTHINTRYAHTTTGRKAILKNFSSLFHAPLYKKLMKMNQAALDIQLWYTAYHSNWIGLKNTCQHIEKIQLLLALGANPTTITPAGSLTALHHASYNGATNLMRLFIDAGANINYMIQDSNNLLGNNILHPSTHHDITPLHIACSKGKTNAIALLINSGADTTMKTQYGKTALDIALETNHFAVHENDRLAIKALLPQ